MDYPIYLGADAVGTVTVTDCGGDTCFHCRCDGLAEGLWRVWVRGQRQRLLLGLLSGDSLRRRFSRRLTEPLGPLRCGLVEPVTAQREEAEPWRPARQEDCPLPLPPGALCRPAGRCRRLALPYAPDSPFPLTELFCFARVGIISGRRWVLLRFDGDRPMPEK